MWEQQTNCQSCDAYCHVQTQHCNRTNSELTQNDASLTDLPFHAHRHTEVSRV